MGRAIVRHPKLFLFDEPLSNLDAKLRVQMRAEIRRLQKRLSVTSLFVTHDQVEAMTLGDRLVVMHEGRAAQIGTPMEVWSKPADTYVASFIGSPAMNFLPATLTEGGHAARLAGGAVWRFTDGARPGGEGQPVTIGIRPEHLLPGGPDGLPVSVDLAEPLGSETVLHGRLADGTELTARIPGGVPGEGLHLAPDLAALHVFDATSGRRLDPG